MSVLINSQRNFWSPEEGAPGYLLPVWLLALNIRHPSQCNNDTISLFTFDDNFTGWQRKTFSDNLFKITNTGTLICCRPVISKGCGPIMMTVQLISAETVAKEQFFYHVGISRSDAFLSKIHPLAILPPTHPFEFISTFVPFPSLLPPIYFSSNNHQTSSHKSYQHNPLSLTGGGLEHVQVCYNTLLTVWK